MPNYHWIIDRGHGVDTPGKRSPKWDDGTPQLFEWEFNNAIAVRLCDLLESAHIRYTFPFNLPVDIPLKSRVDHYNAIQSRLNKVVLSIHGNAAKNPKANGFEVFTSVGETESDKLALHFCRELMNEFPRHRHRQDYSDGDPDKESQFYILRKTNCPAILTENEFFTNPQMCKLMHTQAFRERVAQSHFKAILKIENEQLIPSSLFR